MKIGVVIEHLKTLNNVDVSSRTAEFYAAIEINGNRKRFPVGGGHIEGREISPNWKYVVDVGTLSLIHI